MTIVGVTVTDTEVPAATFNPFDTGSAFMVGLGDWGSSTTPAAVHSQSDVSASIGPRSATNAELWDSCDAFFREGGGTAYLGRVVGPSTTAANLTLLDGSSNNSVIIDATYVGAYGNDIQVKVTNNSSNVVVTLSDTFGNTLAVSPALTTVSAVANWLTSTGYVSGTVGANIQVYEIDSVAISGTPTGGTFTLTFHYNGVTHTTAPIQWNAAATAVASAIVTAGSLPGTLTGTGGALPSSAVTLTASGALTGTFSTMSATSSLTGGSSPAVTYTQSTAGSSTAPGLPATISATSLTGGSDDRADATITNWETALATFELTLGPGQVLAPGQTNTNLSGIWSALGTHALNYNRVAIADCDDNESASTIITDVGNAFNSSGVGPIGFWVGDLQMPGTVAGTVRFISPSPAIAALCARVDGAGNPNRAAAGTAYPFSYITGSKSLVSGANATYNQNDLNTLNSAGINTFASKGGAFVNYGFVGSELPTTDAIRWQFNHLRMLMALQADAEVLGEPFVFSQEDGQGSDALDFANVLQARLSSYWSLGALFGQQSSDAFTVDCGPTVNTPVTQTAGQLNAAVSVRLSPFAQQVNIMLNAVPITQSLSA